MINLITILNAISFIFLLGSILICNTKRTGEHTSYKVLLTASLLTLLFVNFTNILEHSNTNKTLDQYEDIIEILFFPLFIFAILSSVISNELYKRTISENKLKAIFNLTFTFIGLLKKDGVLIEANKSSLEFINTDLNQVVGKKFWDTPWWTNSPEERKKLIQLYTKAMEGENVTMETFHISPQGTKHYIDFSLIPVKNNEGEIEFLIPEGRDITQIKTFEERLKAYNHELQKLVKEQTDELETTLEEYKAVNEELYSKNEELNSINEEIKKKQVTIEQLLDDKDVKNQELVQTNQQIENTLNRLKETQDQLIQNEKMASLGTLTAGIAHEINNPINFINSGITGLKKCISAISGAYDEFQEQVKASGNNETQEFLDTISEKYNLEHNFTGFKVLSENITQGVVRSSEIIKSLRSYLHSDEKSYISTDIHEIIESVLKMLYHEYKNRITIVKQFEEVPKIKCMPGKINQVIMNLISNAIQSIENQGEITISTSASTNKLIISIKDTGVGMSNEVQSKVFDPFFTTKSTGKGTGLGMSISYNIISEHKGQIKVISKEGEGSEFIISLPMK